MAYVGAPFVHDIFVSYSHGDDGTGRAFLQPWSAAFARELERELRTDRRFRKDLRVFRDQDARPSQGLDPMAPLSDQLKKEIGDSAVLMVLMSDDYLASKWCGDERNWWCTRQPELGLPQDGRIAVVRIWPTTEPWPAELKDSRGHELVGFPFYSNHPTAPRPLGYLDPAENFGSEFKKALLDVVGHLYPKLDEIKARLTHIEKAKADAAKLARAAGGQVIYLHGRADHAAIWEQVGNELTNNGYSIVPGEPDPVVSDPKKLLQIGERRVEAMSACDALMLVGTDDGRALDADLVVVGNQDRHAARARSNKLLPCGLLDTTGGAVATSMRRATARNLQAEWLDATQAPLTPLVQKWLLSASESAKP